MEMLSVSIALCKENPAFMADLNHKGLVMWSFGVFTYVTLNKLYNCAYSVFKISYSFILVSIKVHCCETTWLTYFAWDISTNSRFPSDSFLSHWSCDVTGISWYEFSSTRNIEIVHDGKICFYLELMIVFMAEKSLHPELWFNKAMVSQFIFWFCCEK